MKLFVPDSLKEAQGPQSYMTKIYVPIFLSLLTTGERVEQQKVALFSQEPENALCLFVGLGWDGQITKFIKIV